MRIQRQQESDEQQWKEIDFIKLIQLLSFVAMLKLCCMINGNGKKARNL